MGDNNALDVSSSAPQAAELAQLAAPVTKADGSPAEPRAERGVPTVLVVDDDQLVRTLITSALKKGHYRVREAANSEEALRQLQCMAVSGVMDTAPCLTLLDIMLPGMDGLDLCRRIKAEFGTKVIMCTGRTSYSDVQTALHNGADDYLAKPFGLRTLLEKVAGQVGLVVAVTP
jgi:DNA-binding response OmpR family regulator